MKTTEQLLERYDAIADRGVKVGDDNDCAVIALAMATGVSHRKALLALEKAGRRFGKGTFRWETYTALHRLGFINADVTARYPKAKTPITLLRELPRRGTFLVHTRGHVFCVIDRAIMGRTEIGRKLRIEKIYSITKIKRILA